MAASRHFFFLIGVQKAGTTTFYDLLQYTDEVYAPPAYKDFHLFNDPEKYKNEIRDLKKTNCSKILHAAVNYITKPEPIDSINQIFPDAKYIVILRDPVSRALSAFKYMKRMGMEDRGVNEAFRQELKSPNPLSDFNTSYLNHGLYAEQLIDNVYSKVSRRNVGIFFFEEIFNNDRINITPILKFMTVNNFDYPSKYIANEGGDVMFPLVNKIVYQDSLFRRLVGKTIPTRIRRKIKRTILDNNRKNDNGSLSVRENLSSSIYRELLEFYEEDKNKLSGLLNRDVNKLWSC